MNFENSIQPNQDPISEDSLSQMENHMSIPNMLNEIHFEETKEDPNENKIIETDEKMRGEIEKIKTYLRAKKELSEISNEIEKTMSESTIMNSHEKGIQLGKEALYKQIVASFENEYEIPEEAEQLAKDRLYTLISSRHANPRDN